MSLHRPMRSRVQLCAQRAESLAMDLEQARAALDAARADAQEAAAAARQREDRLQARKLLEPARAGK